MKWYESDFAILIARGILILLSCLGVGGCIALCSLAG